MFPVWELHFTKRGDEVHRIATERVKWSAKYQRKYGIKTREAKLPDDVADAHPVPVQARLPVARSERLRAHRPAHGRRAARPT